MANDEIPVFTPSYDVASDADVARMDENPHVRWCAFVGDVTNRDVMPWEQDPQEWDTAAQALREAQSEHEVYSDGMDAGVVVVWVQACDCTDDDEQRDADEAEEAEYARLEAGE